MAGLMFLAVIPYLPTLSLPLISDDYWVIGMSRDFGPVQGWPDLLSDPLYRQRSTSMVLTYWIYSLFGLNAPAYNLTAVTFHVLNTWLLFACGLCGMISWRGAALAAGFFAVYEGHQEAVVWFSALPELMVFFFGLLTILLWWRERFWLSFVAFIMALLSKESAVTFFPILIALALVRKSPLRNLIPMGTATAAYAAMVFLGQNGNQHFQDGTFSLSAPFWETLIISMGRMFWFWGLLSLCALALWRPAQWKLWTGIGAGWMIVTLLPYSFLTYMPRVPSRHTYLASAGLSLLVALAFIQFRERCRERIRWAPAALGAVLIAHNCLYVWLYKHPQYVRRAEPTEALIRMAAESKGPILIKSFPYPRPVAEHSVELMTGKPKSLLLFDPGLAEKAVHVYEWEE